MAIIAVNRVFYLVMYLLYEISMVKCQTTCNKEVRANTELTKVDPLFSPKKCIDDASRWVAPLLAKTNGKYDTPPPYWDRTNSIQDFCIFTNMLGAKVLSKAPPGSSGQPQPLGSAKPDCYPKPPKSSDPTGVTSTDVVDHSAGHDPNWAILQHLVKYQAQSFQPFDDFPYVNPFLFRQDGGDNFAELDPKYTPNPLPSALAPNPYFVEVSGISVKGELLQNFLHFRIFANLSVALGKDQQKRDNILHGKGKYNQNEGEEVPNYAKGKISALLIMVKDQDGWPIGDFAYPVPCSRTCSKYSHEVYYGDERNALPCSYTPPYASMHPGMFVFDVDPGRYCPKPAPPMDPPNAPAPPAPPGASKDQDPRLSQHTARRDGVREVHATWSFGHTTCNFIQRIYIQTLIFEDVETLYEAKILTATDPKESRWMLFGWSAQYNILKTTRGTLGAADYVDMNYLRERDSRANEIDCHVPLFDSKDAVKSSFMKYYAPSHDTITEVSLTEGPPAEDIKVPSRLGYLGALSAQFTFGGGTDEARYLGQHPPSYPDAAQKGSVCRNLPAEFLLSDIDIKNYGDKPQLTISKFLELERNTGERCPCPALPSTLPPENRTTDPARLHGRLIHASHMAIAYMLLTPIGCFVARYYKETFITVFCFQEYWWYMWHVVTLIVACLFNVGAITSIARKKSVELVYNDNLYVHVILGAMSIFVFYLEILTGFFRVADPKKRMRQIFMHWLIGITNNACAVMSMYAMAWVDQSGFSCNVAITVTVWLIFVITCYVVMEGNMRKTDKQLRLIPRRTYLPPPVKRLFTREPPGRIFRLTMLAIFIIGLLIIQIFVSYYIWDVKGGASCVEEYRLAKARRARANFDELEGIDNEEGDGDVDDYS